jgi:hypothetical protein
MVEVLGTMGGTGNPPWPKTLYRRVAGLYRLPPKFGGTTVPDPLTHGDAQRLLDVLQGISRGLIDVNQTLRRIASALEGRGRQL